ncbi:hypothetical protein GCM10027596_35760 [Nocardioides korecus]
MSYIKLDQSHTDDARWLEAGADAFAVHVAAIVYCDRQLLDGRISHAMASRVALAVPPERTAGAIRALVAGEFWTEENDGYSIAQYAEHAFPAEQVRRTRERWNQDKARKRQHNVGDHSLCKDPKFCPAIRSTVEAGVESTSSGSHLYKTRLDQTRPDPTGGKGMGLGVGDIAGSDSAGATSGRSVGDNEDSTPPWVRRYSSASAEADPPDWEKWVEHECAHRYLDDGGVCGWSRNDGDDLTFCQLPESSKAHSHRYEPTQYPHDMTCDYCSDAQSHPVHTNRRETF